MGPATSGAFLRQAPRPEADDTGEFLRVMVLTDTLENLAFVETALGSAEDGYRVRTAAHFSDGPARLEAGGIDAVVLDVSSSDTQALKALRRLRAAHAEVPVVVLTGVGDARAGIAALQAGAQDHLGKDEATARALGRAVRYATERQRLESERARLLGRQGALVELGGSALRGGPLVELFAAAVEVLHRVMEISIATVLELSPDGAQLTIVAGSGLPPDVSGPAVVPADGDSLSGYTLASRVPIVMDDVSKETRFRISDLMQRFGILSSVSVPLVHGDTYGTLSVHTTGATRIFTPDEIAFVTSVGNVLAGAMARKGAERALAERVRELTCLLSINRDLQELTSIDEIGARIVDHVRGAMRSPDAVVPVLDVDGRRFTTPDWRRDLHDGAYAELGAAGITRGALSVLVAETVSLGPEEQRYVSTVAELIGLWLGKIDALYSAAKGEERFRLLVQNSTDIIALVDAEANLLYANPAAERILGHLPDDQVGHSMLDLVHEDDLAGVAEAFERSVLNTGLNEPVEFRMHRSDGTWCYVEAISNNQIENPAVGALVVNARDVSERRATEEELRRNVELLRRTDTERRSLLARVVHVQEEERRRLSGMIHDEPIQSLTAVGMRLQMLRGSVPEAEQPAVSNVENAVCEAIARLRDLMFELRPPILDRGGVVPAIRVYMDRLFGDADLHRTLEDRLEGDLDEDTRLLVYRIVQEALVNVKRHGQAEVLRVALDTKEGGVLVAVSDDGVGFDPDGLRDQAPMRVGVVGMRERAEMAGGWLTVESRPGRGSAVKFWLPGRTDR